MHRLRDLKVYKKALLLTKEIRIVAKSFPKDEIFVLTSQFKRAADSIALNIAEGAGNNSSKEFKRFLSYSIRSGYECIGCLDIALESRFINESIHASTSLLINEVIAMIYGLQKRLRE